MKVVGFAIGWKLFAAVTSGVISFTLLIYFYLAQRHFESNYKEIRNTFHIIDRGYHRLNYEILRSSLFAYTNQDEITDKMAELKREYRILRSNEFLAQNQYAATFEEAKVLGSHLDAYEASVDDFLMLNAGIKNSFVYITSLSAEEISQFKNRPGTYTLILAIIARISQARLLSDPSFLENLKQESTPLGQLDNMNQEEAALIRSFLIHLQFITDNYPAFVRSVRRVETSELDDLLEKMELQFMEEAKTDYVMLDRFVIVLLTLFLVALTVVIGLLLRSHYENRRLRQLEEQLRRSISHDHLTGLLSRSRFEAMQGEFERPTLLLINVDHFKHINDFYGSAAGNAILREIALLIRQPVLEPYRPHFFRFGGDDFGIVLQRVDTERARQLGEMLKRSIESYTFTFEGIESFVTVSVAINNIEPLLENADLMLKYEKIRHSEGVVLFSEELHLKERAKMNIAMTHEVKKALDRDAIVPWYQPIVDLQSGAIVKYEALVRLEGEDGTVSGPGIFLETAMQTPYYRRITAVMLQKVLSAMEGHSHRFSINLGMRDVVDEKMVTMLISLLEAHQDRAARLDIELLESEELNDLEAVHDFIAKVKTYGCQVAIDDFGSGYSNFSYVMELDIDVLKIDGSLITNIDRDPKTRRTVETIVRFAHQLGHRVVAEYVESDATVAALRAMGVEYGQGYYFGRPAQHVEQP